jgi:DNA-binding MarR family transcriptional regulator
MARIEQRGPFLVMFALNQQLSALLAHAMADAPLTPADFAVYSALRLMQPATPTELAATLGMRVTTLSSMLAKMEGLAHLERQRNPADGRSRLISLTDAGVTATQDCFPAFGRAISAFRDHLAVDEQEILRILEAASAAIQAAAADVVAAADAAGSATS